MIADAKRGDVPSTARAYAAAFAPIADAVTVNPYLGYDSLEPFLAHDGLGVLALLKTSNPGSADIQDLPLAGRPSVLAARRGPHRPVGRGLRRRERALLGRGRGRRHASRAARDGAQPAAARSVAPARASARRAAASKTSPRRSRPARRARSSRLRDPSSTPIEARAGRRPRRPRPSGSPASCAPSPPWAEPWTGVASRAGPPRSPSSRRSRSARSSSAPGSSTAGTTTRGRRPRRSPRRRRSTAITEATGAEDVHRRVRRHAGGDRGEDGDDRRHLLKLNPGIDPTALQVGQKIRVQ